LQEMFRIVLRAFAKSAIRERDASDLAFTPYLTFQEKAFFLRSVAEAALSAVIETAARHGGRTLHLEEFKREQGAKFGALIEEIGAALEVLAPES